MSFGSFFVGTSLGMLIVDLIQVFSELKHSTSRSKTKSLEQPRQQGLLRVDLGYFRDLEMLNGFILWISLVSSFRGIKYAC